MTKSRVVLLCMLLFAVGGLLSLFSSWRGTVQKAQSSSVVLTSQQSWTKGSLSNIDAVTSPGSIRINDLSFQPLSLSASNIQANPDSGKENAIDSDSCLTYWSGSGGSYWQIDLGAEYLVDINYYEAVPTLGIGQEVYRRYSSDGTTWTDLPAASSGVSCGINPDDCAEKIWDNISARYFRFEITEGAGGPLKICDFKVYLNQATGTHATAPTQIEAPDTLVSWDSFTPTQTTPSNTKIEYQFRVSTDASNWTDWTSPQELSGSSIDLSSLPTEDADGNKYKYLQIKATLTTYDSNVSPQIDEYQIQYTYNDVCSDVDHIEAKLSTESDSSYGQNRTITLPSSQAKSTVTLNAKAEDSSGNTVSGVSFSYSSDSCVKLSDNQFRAPPEGGSCTITISSSCSNKSTTLTLNVASSSSSSSSNQSSNQPSGSDQDVYCSYGDIAFVEIEPSSFTLSPNESITLKAVFKDKDGNTIDPSTQQDLHLVPTYQDSFWSLTKGGGTLSEEDKDNYTIKFTAGSSPGTFTDSVVFSACGDQLKATATPKIGEEYITVVIDPEELHLEPQEQVVFKARVYDSKGREVTSSSTFKWTLIKEEAGEVVATDKAELTFRSSGKEGLYRFALKVDATYAGASDFAYADIGIKKLSENTDWILRPNFYQLNVPIDEALKIRFIPRIVFSEAKATIYSPKASVSIELLDNSAAKILRRGTDWVLIQPLKEGCFPNVVKGELKWFDKVYTAYSGFNVASKNPFSKYAQYTSEITQVALARKHYVRGQTARLWPKFFDNLGHFYPHTSPFYSASSPGEVSHLDYGLRFVLNDSSLGKLSSRGVLELDSGASLGKHEQAVTLTFRLRDREYSQSWDLYVENSLAEYRIADLPSRLVVPPGALIYLRNFLGFYQNEWGDYRSGFYKVQTNEGAKQLQCCEPFFQAPQAPGTYAGAIVLSSLLGGEDKNIEIVVDEQATLDQCKGIFVKKEAPPQEEAGTSRETTKVPLQIPLLRQVFPRVTGALQSLIVTPFYAWLFPVLTLLVSLPLYFSRWWAVRLVSVVSTLSQWLPPAILFRAKERRKGVVYSYTDKKPLALAIVQVFSYPEHRMVYSTLTNAQGEFVLRIPKGNYYLRVAKRGYKPLEFVSSKSRVIYRAGRTDGYYDNLYYPEELLTIQQDQETVEVSVPMVEEGALKIGLWLKLKEWLGRYSFVFFCVGSLLSLLFFWIQPDSLFNQIVLFYYLLLWAVVVYRWVFYQSARVVVTDNKGKPLGLVLCRITDFKGNLVGVAVSDRQGGFPLELSRGTYLLRFKKPGYQVKEMPLRVYSLASLGEIRVKLKRGKEGG